VPSTLDRGEEPEPLIALRPVDPASWPDDPGDASSTSGPGAPVTDTPRAGGSVRAAILPSA
jgi:hypothetical protein